MFETYQLVRDGKKFPMGMGSVVLGSDIKSNFMSFYERDQIQT